jgi:asparagine synthase (glutamine-hydrolysing)
MCGIAGIVDCGAGLGRETLLEIAAAMGEAQAHRGPDDAGVWVDEAGICALAHRRLSIIDLRPEGRQPMTNESGSVAVTFNGEIYNYRGLRSQLEAHGHRFRSRTDSEVLAHLFEDDAGPVSQLDGMFAFGVWNQERRKLILARDPFGKKPLYYSHGNGWFAFASELSALERIPKFERNIDRDGLGFYLLFGYLPAPWTIYRGVKKLPPGSWLEIDFAGGQPGEAQAQTFARFEPRRPQRWERFRSVGPQVERLRELLVASVAKRLVADVPLGAFLSGGIDSSLVVAIMTRELGVRAQTFSIGFEGTHETEHRFARQVAEHLGTEHHEEIVRPDALEMIHEIVEMLDEPNGDSSCLPTYLLSRLARQRVTVALSGDGGDEVFGGYRRYGDVLRECRGWPQRLRGRLREGRWPSAADSYLSLCWFAQMPDRVAALFGETPPAVRDKIAEWRRRLDDSSLPVIHRLRALDAEVYLPGAVLAKVDRMSMQVALEVRCPLLDRDVAEFAAGLDATACWRGPSESKRVLRLLAARYLPRDWLERPKMGFGIPANTWSMADLLALAEDVLQGPSSRLGKQLNASAVRTFLEEQARPGWFSIYQVWPLLILELWLRGRPAPAAPLGPGSKHCINTGV